MMSVTRDLPWLVQAQRASAVTMVRTDLQSQIMAHRRTHERLIMS